MPRNRVLDQMSAPSSLVAPEMKLIRTQVMPYVPADVTSRSRGTVEGPDLAGAYVVTT